MATELSPINGEDDDVGGFPLLAVVLLSTHFSPVRVGSKLLFLEKVMFWLSLPTLVCTERIMEGTTLKGEI